ncbi:TspO and MBR like protein [Methylobacterium sp. 4-46]|uniref:TspO/MBR family protein n=1 Tax=unclassified Methylobacterium TaxID=2615210 RepID=UPI000165C733|nr:MULTISPECIES: TspO/MBR family protein [Methylobacterium]ACA15931.1 TspO and MBR like protein [Methylobacterium sp. 4-46]WFT81648.1 tryptophan-rich sensory protein [Methylobacterium nodulans]
MTLAATRLAVPSPALRLALAVLPVLATALTGPLFTTPNIPTWYAGLAKPGFTPPNWMFPVAWSMLYAMIALACWRVLGTAPASADLRRGRSVALAAYAVQLALNAIWTPVFFAAHSLLGGLVVIVALLVMILWTIRLFWPLDRAAALLLVPYAGWVAYATAVNAAVWRMN